MGISADVLATALQELMPGYSELFTLWHPLMEKVVLKGNMDKKALDGPYREFVVVQGGPGNVTQVTHGSEVIAGGRNQQAVRGNTYAPRLIYAFDVPGKDLAEANGKQDLARILQHYPELGMLDFHERISDQLGTGNGSGVGGFPTLNGDTTYSPNGTARAGILEYKTPATQGNTVHGLSSTTTTGWQNQYGEIASFAAGGRATMRKVYYACNRQGAKVLGKCDLLLGDETSYLNYITDLDDQVRIVTPSTKEGDRAPEKIRDGVKFLDADFFLEESIDVSAAEFTTAAASAGVIYFLNSATWHMYTLGHDSGKETKGNFATRGPFRIPEQDLFRYEIVLNMGLHTTSKRHNGVVTGGNRP